VGIATWGFFFVFLGFIMFCLLLIVGIIWWDLAKQHREQAARGGTEPGRIPVGEAEDWAEWETEVQRDRDCL
jgi:hypothetical protein